MWKKDLFMSICICTKLILHLHASCSFPDDGLFEYLYYVNQAFLKFQDLHVTLYQIPLFNLWNIGIDLSVLVFLTLNGILITKIISDLFFFILANINLTPDFHNKGFSICLCIVCFCCYGKATWYIHSISEVHSLFPLCLFSLDFIHPFKEHVFHSILFFVHFFVFYNFWCFF